MDTFPALLIENSNTLDTLAIRVKRLGIWKEYKWPQLHTAVSKLTMGLGTLGIEKGDKVAIIASNTPETIIACDAVQAIGGIPVILHSAISGDDLLYVLKNTEAKYAFVDGQQQVDSLFDLNDYPLKKIIYVSPRGLSEYDSNIVVSYVKLLKDMDSNQMHFSELFSRHVSQIKKDDIAFMFFTSGTGAERPKIVPLSYDNLRVTAQAIQKRIAVNAHDSILLTTSLSILPNFLWGYVLNHYFGVCLNCPESRETVLEDMREVNPTILSAQPNVYRHIMMLINKRMSASQGFTGKLYRNGMDGKLNPLMKKLAEVLVYSPIKDIYGLGRLRYAISSGDALGEMAYAFFKTLEIPLIQMYDSVEVSGCISLQTRENTSAEHVGSAMQEVEISEQGEIRCRGDNVFSGYYNDSEMTAKVLKDGWFYTGDYGRMEGNHVVVIDRIDELGTLSDGRKYSPKEVEKSLNSLIQIEDIMIVGDKQPFLSALIVISQDIMGLWADRNNVRYAGFDDLVARSEVSHFVAESVQQMCNSMNDKITKFVLLPRQFSVTNKEKTYTGKLKRIQIMKNFKPVIDAMYQDKSAVQYQDAINGVESEATIHTVD